MAKGKTIEKRGIDSYLNDSERFLKKLFDKPESANTTKINTLLKDSSIPWAVRYHIFPQRHMLLSWYPFKKSASLFEIGAGYGALTGLFLEKLSNVTCNELSPSRANIIQKRFNNYKNLTIYSKDINNFDPKVKYDYVTLIGVLEYAAKYSKSSDPYVELLITARKLLKPNGHLLLAIENKIGLKYLAGAPEDHTGIVFNSLENYPQNPGVRTFTRNELIELLNKSGFANYDFYYPFPDYKLPQIVFSEEGMDSINQLTKSSITQNKNTSQPSHILFNEITYSYLLIQEGLLREFSNSFLIDAQIK